MRASATRKKKPITLMILKISVSEICHGFIFPSTIFLTSHNTSIRNTRKVLNLFFWHRGKRPTTSCGTRMQGRYIYKLPWALATSLQMILSYCAISAVFQNWCFWIWLLYHLNFTPVCIPLVLRRLPERNCLNVILYLRLLNDAQTYTSAWIRSLHR